MRASCVLALLALLAVTRAFGAGTTTPTGTTRQCVDPCFQAARATLRECVSSASGAFTDALGGCLEREHECVGACRGERQACRDDTGLAAGLADCGTQLVAERARCRSQFPPGSIRLAACLDRAEIAASRCRRQVRRDLLRALRACQAAFQQCTAACGGGQPPLGSGECRSEARAAFRADVTACRQTFQASASACIGKDVMCVPDCTEARETCSAPTQAALDAALAACTAQEATAVASCVASNPPGSAALEQCVQAAQAAAFDCREAALAAVKPGFAACTQQFLSCLKACPPA